MARSDYQKSSKREFTYTNHLCYSWTCIVSRIPGGTVDTNTKNLAHLLLLGTANSDVNEKNTYSKDDRRQELVDQGKPQIYPWNSSIRIGESAFIM